jgi:DNA-binding NarL/FixJ family response regulator
MQKKEPTHQTMKGQGLRPHKVLIADDHDIFRHGLKNLLSKYSFLKFKGEVSNGKDLVKMVAKEKPDLVFLDLHMPGGDGVDAVVEILTDYPEVKIIVLSFYNDALTVERLMKLGAVAYLTKNISLEILDAMFEKVLHNEKYICPDAAHNVAMNKISPNTNSTKHLHGQWQAEEISPREKQVLQLIVHGMSLKEIGKEMHLSSRTAESHKLKLMKKTGAKNLAELIFLAHDYKLV